MHKKADQLEAELLPFIQKKTIIVYMLADSVQTLPPTSPFSPSCPSVLRLFPELLALFFFSDKNPCHIRIA